MITGDHFAEIAYVMANGTHDAVCHGQELRVIYKETWGPGIVRDTTVAVEERVSVNDIHATVLHLLGIDHKRLTYRHDSRDVRLTDVAGHVVDAILG